MYRVTLFALVAIYCISTVCGTAVPEDLNDDKQSLLLRNKRDFSDNYDGTITTSTVAAAGLGTGLIAVIALVSMCPFALILCCCCCACCPCYYCCRPRSTNVTVVNSGGGGGGSTQNNFSVPQSQPMMTQQYAPMGQQHAPMPQQYTRMPEPDMVTPQHAPPQYSQEKYGQP